MDSKGYKFTVTLFSLVQKKVNYVAHCTCTSRAQKNMGS